MDLETEDREIIERLDELLYAPRPAERSARPLLLEVHQVWGSFLVDTRHMAIQPGAVVRVGPRMQHRWSVLGADMGRVPQVMRHALALAPPLLSDVEQSPACELFAPDEAVLFEVIDGQWFAHVPADARCTVRVDGVVSETPPGLFPLSADTQLELLFGGIAYHARLVPGAAALDRPAPEPDFPLLASGSSLGFVGLLFAIIVMFSPRPPSTDLLEVPERMVEMVRQTVVEDDKEEEAGDPEPEGERAEKEEGKAGETDAKMEVARGGKDAKRELDRQVAEDAGLLGAMSDDPAMAAMFGSASLSGDLSDSVAGMIGVKGTQIGTNGMGSRGGGLGGGGEVGSLTSGLGTHGIGTGDRAYGTADRNTRKPEGGIVRESNPLIIGSMDRALIDEVVKKHMSQLRYCYQREVTKDPSLAGKVVTRFTIATDGSVAGSDIRSSTVGSEAVDRCVRSTFMKMRFPEPKGGGIVIVSYPLMFSL